MCNMFQLRQIVLPMEVALESPIRAQRGNASVEEIWHAWIKKRICMELQYQIMSYERRQIQLYLNYTYVTKIIQLLGKQIRIHEKIIQLSIKMSIVLPIQAMDTLIRVQPIDVVRHRGLRMENANICMTVHTVETGVRRTLRAKDILKV